MTEDITVHLTPKKEEEFDDPIYHVAELTLPEEVIWGDRPTDTSERHDFYLDGADLDEVPAKYRVNNDLFSR
jgi:hypothetical protein